jgi:type VI protein secretion system component VasF
MDVISALPQFFVKSASRRSEMESHRLLPGWANERSPMRLSALETALLAACVVLAVVVAYWGLKILAA